VRTGIDNVRAEGLFRVPRPPRKEAETDITSASLLGPRTHGPTTQESVYGGPEHRVNRAPLLTAQWAASCHVRPNPTEMSRATARG